MLTFLVAFEATKKEKHVQAHTQLPSVTPVLFHTFDINNAQLMRMKINQVELVATSIWCSSRQVYTDTAQISIANTIVIINTVQ